MLAYLVVIQARINSTRFPGKSLETVGGKPMVKRVWDAAKRSFADKVVVAWPERYYYVPEENVLQRFRNISLEFPSQYIIRLTSDCPLLSTEDINSAIRAHQRKIKDHDDHYYNNRRDGFDVQIFPSSFLYTDLANMEHVINDVPNTGGLSVNTKADLERVRKYAK